MKKIYIICLILNLFLLAESRGQGLTVNDMLIAHDSVHSVTFNEQTCWFAKRMLMEKLLSDTNLISQDTSITNFYSCAVRFPNLTVLKNKSVS